MAIQRIIQMFLRPCDKNQSRDGIEREYAANMRWVVLLLLIFLTRSYMRILAPIAAHSQFVAFPAQRVASSGHVYGSKWVELEGTCRGRHF
jgi:hypothetical protein